MSISLRRLLGGDADVLADRDFRLLLLASLISPMGASVVSPVVESLTGPYGVSATEAGLLLSAFTAPGIVFIPVAGVLADRYGRKPVLAGGLALFGLAGLALTLTTDFRVALLLRLLQGVGYTGIGPILITATGDLFSGARESAAQGVRFTAVGASLTVFPFLAGLLVAFAWQYPFALYAAAIPVAAVVWLRFEESAALGGERSAAAGAPADGDPNDADRSGVRALLALAARPRVAATLFGRAAPGFLWFGFLTYNSIVVVRLLGGTPAPPAPSSRSRPSPAPSRRPRPGESPPGSAERSPRSPRSSSPGSAWLLSRSRRRCRSRSRRASRSAPASRCR
ncbi:MFS transporter [Halobaculum halobium]|uniref:MFS transporter n=1 Tax=Halobaculum halobium TaxID=3032281 RepID=A0ABD5TFP7_9EURY|nr:MFS transporter [Halobaculum sp. SYNS20]